MSDITDRLTDLEVYIANQERTLDDLNQEVLRLSRRVAELERQTDRLKSALSESLVKPLSEETPPPHY